MYKVTRPFTDRVTNRAYLTGDIYTAEDARIRELLFGRFPAIAYVAQPDMPETVQPIELNGELVSDPEPAEAVQDSPVEKSEKHDSGK